MRRDGAEGIRLLLEGKGKKGRGLCDSELVVTVRVRVPVLYNTVHSTHPASIRSSF